MTDDKATIRKHCGEIRRLFLQSYWAKDRSIEVIEKSVEQSLCFAIFDTEIDTMVAFARVITDYATMYYLCDVIVDEKYRGNGLGKMLVNWIVNEEERLKGQYGVLLTRDAQGLYSQFGFRENERCMCKY
ncbi:MAG: GNAT family N-acetyltransferase [Lachnospiraceae bacterium]|nr:GNAT family N-acetyltransferase [Lachnospiraceae bacterium]